MSGYFTDRFIDKDYNAVDTVKAYTHCMQQIDAVPVFGYFDVYEPYDGHPIEDLTMYCIRADDKERDEGMIVTQQELNDVKKKLKIYDDPVYDDLLNSDNEARAKYDELDNQRKTIEDSLAAMQANFKSIDMAS